MSSVENDIYIFINNSEPGLELQSCRYFSDFIFQAASLSMSIEKDGAVV